MFKVVLHEPEIPPNTGNIIRLCANTGSALHLIEPLGFGIDDARLRRAGLDYREFASMAVHPNLQALLDAEGSNRLFTFSTRGETRHDHVQWQSGDAMLFGPETRGLPDSVLAMVPAERRIRLPMRPDNRSLNLGNAVAIAVFEAWRQHDFAGAI